jgi:hypothetical protein
MSNCPFATKALLNNRLNALSDIRNLITMVEISLGSANEEAAKELWKHHAKQLETKVNQFVKDNC